MNRRFFISGIVGITCIPKKSDTIFVNTIEDFQKHFGHVSWSAEAYCQKMMRDYWRKCGMVENDA